MVIHLFFTKKIGCGLQQVLTLDETTSTTPAPAAAAAEADADADAEVDGRRRFDAEKPFNLLQELFGGAVDDDAVLRLPDEDVDDEDDALEQALDQLTQVRSISRMSEGTCDGGASSDHKMH